MKQTSLWDIKLKCRLTVNGSTADDLGRELTKLGFHPKEDLLSFEKVEEHLDLPLVSFEYHDGTDRLVRVVTMNDQHLCGYDEDDGSQYKTFLISRISNGPILEELPKQQD